MDPISNQVFSHDSVKYVFQDPDVRIVNQGPPPSKPFEIKAAEKSKKTKNEKKKKEGKGEKGGEKRTPLSKLLGF